VTQLEQLPTTDSGHVVKRHATEWLNGLEEATEQEIRESVVAKPNDFSGRSCEGDCGFSEGGVDSMFERVVTWFSVEFAAELKGSEIRR